MPGMEKHPVNKNLPQFKKAAQVQKQTEAALKKARKASGKMGNTIKKGGGK